MPHNEDTPDVEHLFFSERLAPDTVDRPSCERPAPPFPWGMYAGCLPEVRSAGSSAAAGQPSQARAGDEPLESGWGGLTLELPGSSRTFPWIWLDADD